MSYVEKINGYDIKDAEAITFASSQTLSESQKGVVHTNIGIVVCDELPETLNSNTIYMVKEAE